MQPTETGFFYVNRTMAEEIPTCTRVVYYYIYFSGK